MALVLIIDDDADIRHAMAELLALDGHEVAEAAEGEQGLVRCRGLRPDLVLLDLMMPGMSGWDFLRAKAREEAIAAIPVVVVSAQGRPEGLPVAGFLPKPFRLGELRALVQASAGGGAAGDWSL